MLGLSSAAEEPDPVTGLWGVTPQTLKNSLDFYYAKKQLGTQVKLGSFSGSPIIRHLPGPPDVEISVEILPATLSAPYAVSVCDLINASAAVAAPTATKFDFTMKVGFYRLQIDTDHLQSSPYRAGRQILRSMVRPWTHDLTKLLKPQV